MLSRLKKFWRRLQNSYTPPKVVVTNSVACCPDCVTAEERELSSRVMHLVESHLTADERWLLKMLFSNYHLSDLCAVLGVGPDTVRYRVTALRAKILLLLRRQHADACVKRAFHRLISGPWF